jgi:SAM-dependent methyltransferase
MSESDPALLGAAGSRGQAADREREFFDRFVEQEGEFNPFDAAGWQTLTRRFSEMVPLTQKVELLDVGCGTGCSRQIYAAHTQRYVGVDLSSRAIERARGSFPEVEWQVADACALPFPEASFDVVAFSSVLHHVPARLQAIREAFRVLRAGGAVFAFDPNLLHPAMALFRHPRSPFYRSEGVSPDECPLLPRVLRQDFHRAGFAGIKQRCQSGISYRAVAVRGLNTFLRVYNCLDRLWERSGMARIFGTFVITTGRKPDRLDGQQR